MQDRDTRLGETPGGFSKASCVYLEQLFHQSAVLRAEVELSPKARGGTRRQGYELGACCPLHRQSWRHLGASLPGACPCWALSPQPSVLQRRREVWGAQRFAV